MPAKYVCCSGKQNHKLNQTMKKLFVLLTAMAFAAAAFAVEIGKPAPDFTGTDISGKTVKLSDYKGKIVVLESYNSDCPFCHNHYASGAMQELQKELAAKGVVWLLVDSVNTKNFSYRTPAQAQKECCLLYTSPSPRDGLLSRMPSSA